MYLLKVFPKQKYPPKYSKAKKEAIKKMDEFSESVRFLGKHNISKLAEVKEYKNNALNEIVELKGNRENLWRKHNRVKTDKERQFICSEIGFLAKKIDELRKDITICENIENRTLKIREDIKEIQKDTKSKVKNKEDIVEFFR